MIGLGASFSGDDFRRSNSSSIAELRHELRNALVPMRAIAALIENRADDPHFREWARQALTDEVQRIQAVLADLADPPARH